VITFRALKKRDNHLSRLGARIREVVSVPSPSFNRWLQRFFPVRYTFSRTAAYCTFSVKVVLCVNGPLVPVTVTVEVPGRVPGIVL
jgi:hypothetical protein